MPPHHHNRSPRQIMPGKSIDGLCKQGTDIEGQFGVTAADALIEKQSACDNHRVWFQVRGSNLRWRCTFRRFSPGSHRACSQSRSSVPTPPSETIDIGLRIGFHRYARKSQKIGSSHPWAVSPSPAASRCRSTTWKLHGGIAAAPLVFSTLSFRMAFAA